MKKIYTSARKPLFLILGLCSVFTTRGQDLPGAASNFQTAPAGTIVIAMDNTTQAASTPNAAGTYLFNLRSYGLAIYLLDVSFPIQWVIRAGKGHNEIDFTGTAERVTPSYLPPQTYDFKAGPILIFPQDTLSVISAINIYNAGNPDSCKVKVYRLTSPAVVDVRYTLTRPPKAALLHDSCVIHTGYMWMGGVLDVNYDCVPNAYNLTRNCYTIVTAPHTTPGMATSFDADSIEAFVLQGGNYLAQCEAVRTFEEIKKFQSFDGVLIEASQPQINTLNDTIIPNNTFPNADMSYAQFEGAIFPRLRGAFQNWQYQTANINNWYPIQEAHKTGDPTIFYTATVTKHGGGAGALVFYLGNHEFFVDGGGCYQCAGANNQVEVNGIRAYLNAVLTPSQFMGCVIIEPIPLVVKLGEFNVYKQSNQTVKLKWNSLTEKENQYYIIEYSTNGQDWTGIGQVKGYGDTDTGHEYEFIHTDPRAGLNYYRLRMISLTGQASFSGIRQVIFDTKTQQLHIYPNPASNSITLVVDLRDGEKLNLEFYDATGRQVKNQPITIQNQRSEISITQLSKGIYWIVGTRDDGSEVRGKLVVQ